MNDAGMRNISFEELAATYETATTRLLEGGADILMIETIFDTLNAKAAIFAVEKHFEKRGSRVPVMISGTITDAERSYALGPDGRGLLELGLPRPSAHHRAQLRAGSQAAAAVCPGPLPDRAGAGQHASQCRACPTPSASYDETPETMAAMIREFATSGLVNIVGRMLRYHAGAYPRHRARRCAGWPRGSAPHLPPRCRLAGMEPLTIGPETNFVNVGERTNVTGSRRFAKLILDGEYETGAGGGAATG